jgi:hypothetical protein
MAKWEYIVLTARAEGPDAADAAEARWLELLNTRGAEGWELITEHRQYFAAIGDDRGATANYRGTLKREGTRGRESDTLSQAR